MTVGMPLQNIPKFLTGYRTYLTEGRIYCMEENKKILFLGGEPGTCEMIKYAQEQGAYTIVTDWFDVEHSKAKQSSDEYWMVSYKDIDTLERKCRQEKISAVMSASSEFATGIMIELCERLNLPCFATKEAFHYEKDKADFRIACRECNVRIPRYLVFYNELDKEKLMDVEFPVIVKPVDQSGGKGMTYCFNYEELESAFQRAKEYSDNPKIIVEEKISGPVFTVYYAFAEGEAALLCMQSEIKANTGQRVVGSCFASSTATNYVNEYVAQVNDKIIEVLKKCGCRENMAWVEVIRDSQGDFYAIEMATRLGQDYIPVEYSKLGGFNLITWGMDFAFGRWHKKEELPKGLECMMEKFAYSYMLCCGIAGVVKEIRGTRELEKHSNVDLFLNICIGDKLQVSGKEVGYVGFHTNNRREAYEIIEKINSILQIVNEKGENMLLPYATVERFKLEDL